MTLYGHIGGGEPGGPYFDDLAVGQVFDWAPSVTLTSGLAAAHQQILGDRLRLALDAELAHAVTGVPGVLAHPGLVWDVAIGQSTLATQRVKANLFYRGLAFHYVPRIGDTLFTRTEVVGLRQNGARPDRAPTGLAALRMTTVDQAGRLVLDFHRCAMLPLSPGAADTGHADDLSAIGVDATVPVPSPIGSNAISHWDTEAFRRRVPGPHFSPDMAGSVLRSTADVVSSAPELARLTLNIAAVHHDAGTGAGRRLVYGGHTVGLALAQASRLLPNLGCVLAWRSCDHIGPVYEDDTLVSELTVQSAEPIAGGGGLLGLRSVVFARGGDGSADRHVLNWDFVALQC